MLKLFVVRPRYCPITDGFVGTNSELLIPCADRSQARAAVSSHVALSGGDDEISYELRDENDRSISFNDPVPVDATSLIDLNDDENVPF